MKVKFAKTLRKYVRTEEWKLKEALWTEETSAAADDLLKFLKENPDLSDDSVLEVFFGNNCTGQENAAEQELAAAKEVMYTEVWERLHVYPYYFELQAARGILHQDLVENHRRGEKPEQSPWMLQTVSRKNWRVAGHEWFALIDNGKVSLGVLEFFNKSFVRSLLQKNMILHIPFLLAKMIPCKSVSRN